MTSDASGDGRRPRSRGRAHRDSSADAATSTAILNLRESKLKLATATIALGLGITALLPFTREKPVDACRSPDGCARQYHPRHPEGKKQSRCEADPAAISDPEDVTLHCMDMTPGETLTIHMRSGRAKKFEPIRKERVQDKDFYVYLDLSAHVTDSVRSADLFIVGNKGSLSQTKVTFTD
ncbi:hypothetical protein ACTOB_006066 [Actinoplanes oblitus]|uniref:Uncharacterized protein n=1 Tax=Actinoplanes oblitus TaxID=3040509 RepID=A0ABY8WAA1_9ACTN|nr:hypothetical protein [Actinoplanes oblitus]WIM94066.1 hypothetical protein ACTOB_006066 [Actinoplanes oblitus]